MIHRYKLNGYNIVLDVYSGSVHVVDPLAYDIIGMYETSSKEEITKAMLEKYAHQPDVTPQEIAEVLDSVEQLKAAGKLFAPDKYEGMAFDFKNRNTVIKALCMHVAHTCNLTCDYCFASQGKYQGERALMSFEVGKQALDFLIANSGSRKNLEVDFFGGEPLMNWEVVKQLVAYGREQEKIHNKNFRFTLTTNGVLLNDEVIAAVRQIEEVTPSYERSDLVAVVNANLRPVSHPLLTEYRPLQQLCLKILRQEDVGLRFNADSEPVYGVLFDIAYLWEEYLALFLKPLGFEHPSIVANHGWPVANLDGKDVMRFCPDFVFPDTQGIKPPTASLVADAKYTRYETKRFDDRTKHHVLQMLHYMYMLKAQRSVLLSPAHIDEPKQWPFVLYGYGGTIGVEYLTMPSQAQSYAVFCAAMQQAENDFVEKIKPYLAAN